MNNSRFWDVTVPRVLSTYAVAICALLWAGLAVALVVNRQWLDQLWDWVRALPLVPEIVVWVAFLPIMTALWIWQSSWPVLVQLLAWGGIVGWTALAISGLIRAWK